MTPSLPVAVCSSPTAEGFDPYALEGDGATVVDPYAVDPGAAGEPQEADPSKRVGAPCTAAPAAQHCPHLLLRRPPWLARSVLRALVAPLLAQRLAGVLVLAVGRI